MLAARDLMTKAPASVGPLATVRDAVDILQTLDIRHLPVVNEDNELIGMLSDRDLRALSIPTFIGDELVGNMRTALNARVSALMSSDVLSVDPEADAAEVIDLMLDNKVGAIPVTENGLLVGIVSYVNILRKLPFDSAAE
jgi:acetoin utilization protein AcuB